MLESMQTTQQPTQSEIDRRFMQIALDQAHLALSDNEVPVGCLITFNNEVIATSYNTMVTHCNATAHAEVNAIKNACQYLDNYRLTDCTLYVTLEPCIMCAGAIVNARIKRVVFGCFDERFGAGGSCLNVLQCDWLNHRCEIETGVLSHQCKQLLQSFFIKKRIG